MASTLQGDDEDYLVRCVRLALEQQAHGVPVDTAALCRERPHLQRALAEALGLADQLPVLQRDLQEVDPLAGLLLAGRYRLRACLGRGAMGVVYRADDQELRRQVAVKILDARLFADPQAVQRFQREAEILAGLRHAAVVAVHDRGRTPEGIAFLVMELLEGVSLAALIDRIARAEQEGRDGRAQPDTNAVFTACGIAPAPAGLWRQAAQWGAAIADALSAAHEAGVVHRDIKPSNVFVRRDGTVVLLDFGIAARGDGARLTATTTTLGTPWYMAPEQVAAGGFEPTTAQDIYGLGATVWHLLAGRPPYEGSAPAVMAALPHRDPPPLRTVRAELPRDLVAIVERAMERDPRRRYATAALLAADFRAFLEHRPVSARPLSALQRRWRAVRRAPAKALGGLAAILAVVLVAAVLPLQQQQAARARTEQKAALLARLPSLLAVEGQPHERLVAELDPELRAGEALCDEILALDPDELPVRLFRAALQLDRGNHAAAAADLQAMVASRPRGYLAALAQRYAAADRNQRGTKAVDVQGLPEPETPEECFVAGFHELRNRDVPGFAERAQALLQRAGADYLPAVDLGLIATVARTDTIRSGRERAQLFQKAYDDALQLRGRYGRPTARIQAMAGAALVGLKRYADAVPVLQEALQLRPDRHGPHQNLGVAFHRLGQLDLAEQHLTAAHRLRPFASNTKMTWARVRRDRGDFAGAYEWAAKVSLDSAEDRWQQPDLVASIAIAEAFANRDQNPGIAAAAALRAKEALGAALSAAPAEEQVLLRVRQGVAAALVQGGTGLVDYLNLAQLQPEDPYTIANAASLLGDRVLDPKEALMLGIYLRRLALARVAGDTQLRERLEAEIKTAHARLKQ
jgi:hypothetical protein